MFWAANDLVKDAERLIEDRFVFELPAVLHAVSRARIPCVLINLSRDGFRVNGRLELMAETRVWLEVATWPRLLARTTWSRRGSAGFAFTSPIAATTFAMMLQSAMGPDRQGDDILI